VFRGLGSDDGPEGINAVTRSDPRIAFTPPPETACLNTQPEQLSDDPESDLEGRRDKSDSDEPAKNQQGLYPIARVAVQKCRTPHAFVRSARPPA
jgi:hypothetical protein